MCTPDTVHGIVFEWPAQDPYSSVAYYPVMCAGMMSEIIQRGPITCSIACPNDFVFNYHGGVFVDKTNNTDVDHDIEVVGWGHEDGWDYWHIRNSWGKLCSSFKQVVYSDIVSAIENAAVTISKYTVLA